MLPGVVLEPRTADQTPSLPRQRATGNRLPPVRHSSGPSLVLRRRVEVALAVLIEAQYEEILILEGFVSDRPRSTSRRMK